MELRELSLKYDKDAMEALLALTGLRPDKGLEYAAGLFEGGRLIAMGGYEGATIKCLAVDPDRQGEALLNTLVSHLYTTLRRGGVGEVFIFTKPGNVALLNTLGFRALCVTPPAALLTGRPEGIEAYVSDVKASVKRAGFDYVQTDVGAIVMNANPFTLGHRYLVESAKKACELLHIFVVEEDKSFFPFQDRLELVRRGVEDMPRVLVHPGGRYIISAATFPSYFLKDPEGAAPAHALLDSTLFAQRLAPPLYISKRFVGEEPLDPLTRLYNETMESVLPLAGISLTIIPRRESSGAPISASRVRKLFCDASPNDFAPLVPQSTYEYLIQRLERV